MGEKPLVGYVRVSKSDGSQSTALQHDALVAAGVDPGRIYEDRMSGSSDDRPGLKVCLEVLRPGDTLIVWKLDRLGRNLSHLVSTIDFLSQREISFRVLTGAGGGIDTGSSHGRMIFGIFASLAEFERQLIRERTLAGLQAARARGREGGRPSKLDADALAIIQTAMQSRSASVNAICRQFGITKTTLYRLMTPKGELREDGLRLALGTKIKMPCSPSLAG